MSIALTPKLAIENISIAIDRGSPFWVNPDTLKVRTLSYFERLWRYKSHRNYNYAHLYQQTCEALLDQKTVDAFKRILTPLENHSPSEVGEDRLIRVISRFYRKLSKEQALQPAFVRGKDELLAIKLGIPVAVLNMPKNAAFKEFAKVNFLDRYLWKYGHCLVINSFDDNDIRIRIVKDDPTKDILWSDLKNSNKLDEKGKIRGVYLQSGITDPVDLGNGKFANWKEFKPFMKGDASKWGYIHLFEFCAWSLDSGPRCEGDHTWFRLYTPQGDIYSAGIYRPGKAPGTHSRVHPLRKQIASLHSPDESEVCPDETYKTIQVSISELKFKEIKEEVEKHKLKEIEAASGKGDVNSFQSFGDNCTKFAKNMARIADIEIPTAKMYPKVFLPKAAVWLPEKVYSVLPSFLQKIANVIAAVFFNTIAFFAGAGKIDKSFPIGSKVKPLLSKFWDVFDIKKTYIDHPYTLGHETRDRVLKWREAELAKLKRVDYSEIWKIEHSLPPEFATAKD